MNEWQEIEINSVIEKANTGLDAIKRAPIVDYDSGIKCLRIQDVSQNKSFQDWGFCEVTEDNYAKFQLRKNDILLARTGASIGVNKFVAEDLISVFNNGLIRVRVDTSQCVPKFIYYNFRTPNYKGYIESISGGTSTQPNMQINALLRFVINLPLLEEQMAITAVLSSLDEKIDLLHRQNKTLEALAQTLFRHWFIETADDDWEEQPLMDFIDFKEGPGIRNWQYVEDEDGINFINIRLIKNGDINLQTANKISREEAFGKYAHFLLKEDDMIVSTSGTLGRSAIVRTSHLPLCLNTSVIRFRPVDEIHYSFMYQYLQSKEFLSQLTTMASGSVQLNFGPTHLKRITMVIPPSEVLDAFEKSAGPLYQKLKANYLQIRTIEELRDTLLPKLMNGKVRVRL